MPTTTNAHLAAGLIASFGLVAIAQARPRVASSEVGPHVRAETTRDESTIADDACPDTANTIAARIGARVKVLEAVRFRSRETSFAYGPLVADLLVREVLHPYRGMVIAASGGLLRPRPSQWSIDGRPEALRRAVETSLQVLGLERLDLWQLQRIDPDVPIDDQYGAIAEMQRVGLIRFAMSGFAT